MVLDSVVVEVRVSAEMVVVVGFAVLMMVVVENISMVSVQITDVGY